MDQLSKTNHHELSALWNEAYRAKPQVCKGKEGGTFCVFTLTEGTETIFPKRPRFAVDGKELTSYRLGLVSTTRERVLSVNINYYTALPKLEPYKLDETENEILIRALSLAELEEIIRDENRKGENRIHDTALKERIADYAVNSLQKDLDYTELANTIVQFGYLYEFENHGLEALFKVVTDRTSAYFAVQGEKMMRLNLTEAVFDAYVDSFLELNRK